MEAELGFAFRDLEVLTVGLDPDLRVSVLDTWRFGTPDGVVEAIRWSDAEMQLRQDRRRKN